MLVFLLCALVQSASAQMLRADEKENYVRADRTLSSGVVEQINQLDSTQGALYNLISKALRDEGFRFERAEMLINHHENEQVCENLHLDSAAKNCSWRYFQFTETYRRDNGFRKVSTFGRVYYRTSNKTVIAIDLEEVLIRCGAENCH